MAVVVVVVFDFDFFFFCGFGGCGGGFVAMVVVWCLVLFMGLVVTLGCG